MKYFLGTIEHLVCRKIGSIIFKNRLTNSSGPNIFNRDFLFQNLTDDEKKVNFPRKIKLLVFHYDCSKSL